MWIPKLCLYSSDRNMTGYDSRPLVFLMLRTVNTRSSQANTKTSSEINRQPKFFDRYSETRHLFEPYSTHVYLWMSNRTEFRVKLLKSSFDCTNFIRTHQVLMYSLTFISWPISPFSWSGGYIIKFWMRQNYFVTCNCKYFTIYAIIIIIHSLLVKKDLRIT